MKRLRGWIFLGSLCGGTLWAEYHIALFLGVGGLLFASASALAVVASALYRAPEGYDGPDGFHPIPRRRRARLVRPIRLSQPVRARQRA